MSYALKANYNTKLLNILINSGVDHVTTVSGNELKIAEQFSEKLNGYVFNGTGKKLAELREAQRVSKDTGKPVYINIDSEFDYDRIKVAIEDYENVKIMIRYNPDVTQMPNIHPYVATALANSKFGMNRSSCVAILKKMVNEGVKCSGIHTHLGSTISEISLFEQAIAAIKLLLGDCEEIGVDLQRILFMIEQSYCAQARTV